MLARYLRRVFGSVRLFITLAVCIVGLAIAIWDAYAQLVLKIRPGLSTQLYTFLIALAGNAVVFVFNDTKRPSGYSAKGFRYDSDEEGKP